MITGVPENPTPGGATPADSLIGTPIEAVDVRPARVDTIEVTVTGLGYDLVEVERLPRGLLRVTIDRLPGRVYGSPGAPDAGEFITVVDCERVTRQLQFALEVSGMAYERLEVSSPGLDRLLKTEDHLRRFVGEAVSITLKLPFQGRKHWTGELQAAEPPATGWRLLMSEVPTIGRPGAPRKAAPKAGKPSTRAAIRAALAAGTAGAAVAAGAPGVAGAETPLLALDFQFGEVREARLVPVVNFKGRPAGRAPDDERVTAPAADTAMNGDLDR